jgi:hypothetical protein
LVEATREVEWVDGGSTSKDIMTVDGETKMSEAGQRQQRVIKRQRQRGVVDPHIKMHGVELASKVDGMTSKGNMTRDSETMAVVEGGMMSKADGMTGTGVRVDGKMRVRNGKRMKKAGMIFRRLSPMGHLRRAVG